MARQQRAQQEHWAVSVHRRGDLVVTIDSNCLAGRELLPGDDDTIRIAARNLLGFIGESNIECELRNAALDQLHAAQLRIAALEAQLKAAREEIRRYVNGKMGDEP